MSSYRLLALTVVAIVSLIDAAPIAPCMSCKHNCQAANTTLTPSNGNSTLVEDVSSSEQLDTNLIEDVVEAEERHRRKKREVEQRACSRFQMEMVLIPLAIAMIPIGLCAMLLCTCCCGPEESRGKMPENFSLSRLSYAKELDELEYKDDYVRRKDSSRTKFSTTVSFIEARRNSAWSAHSADSTNSGPAVVSFNAQALRKVASTESMKKTRFSDTVSVLGADELRLSK